MADYTNQERGSNPRERITVWRGVKEGRLFKLPLKRAAAILEANPPTRFLTGHEAFYRIIASHPRWEVSIHRAVGYQNVPSPSGNLNILYLWTDSFAPDRDGLYDSAGDVLRETGWYPYTTGEFMFPFENEIDIRIRKAVIAGTSRMEKDPMRVGDLKSVQDIFAHKNQQEGEGKGSSFLLTTSESKWLLDFGFDFETDYSERTDYLVLSHYHQDHSGGLLRAFETLNPDHVIMSETTAKILATTYKKSPRRSSQFSKVLEKLYSPPLRRLNPSIHGSVRFFSSNHTHGSIGTLLVSDEGRSFMYTGDIAFTNAFGSTDVQNLVRWLRGDEPVDVALVDAALAGRAAEELDFDRFGVLHLEESIKERVKNGRTSLVIAEEAELCVRAYFLLYKLLMQDPEVATRMAVYIDEDSYSYMKWLAAGYARHQWKRLDDDVKRILRKGGGNPFGSPMLFVNDFETTRISLQWHLYRNRPLVFINRISSLTRLLELWREVGMRLEQEDAVYLLGRLKMRVKSDNSSGKTRALTFISQCEDLNRAMKYHSNDLKWSLHSQEDVLRLVLNGGEWAREVYLYHNSDLEKLWGLARTVRNPRMNVLPMSAQISFKEAGP